MSKGNKELRHKQYKRAITIAKFSVLIVVIVVVPFYIYFFHKDMIEQMSSLSNVREYLATYKTQSILVYIGAQAAQIIICIIPGQWLQIAAGYLYGFWLGYLYSFIGAVIGSILTYNLAKWLGRDAVHMIFGEERFQEYMHKVNSKKGIIIIFLIFLIPGIPKDLCNYVAGLSDIKLKPFLIVSLIGRTPGMMGSLIIGRQLSVGGYHVAIVVAIIAIILFIMGIIFRKKIMHWLDSGYDKLSHM